MYAPTLIERRGKSPLFDLSAPKPAPRPHTPVESPAVTFLSVISCTAAILAAISYTATMFPFLLSDQQCSPCRKLQLERLGVRSKALLRDLRRFMAWQKKILQAVFVPLESLSEIAI